VDEADTLMERDFGELIRELMDRIRLNGKQCQHIFVSATIPRSLNQNVDRLALKDFVRIVTPRLHRPVPKLRQRFIELDGHGDSKQSKQRLAKVCY
jgi:superfamily II DNA/RNA helicase